MKAIYPLILLSAICFSFPLVGMESSLMQNVNVQEKMDQKFSNEMCERTACKEFEEQIAVNLEWLARLTSKTVTSLSSSCGYEGPVEYFTSHIGAWHSPIGSKAQGHYVMLEDTSGWLICEDDACETKTWLATDTVVITPAPFYSWYDYLLVNCRSGHAAQATLKDLPSVHTEHTLWIKEINRDKGWIRLNDNTVWESCWFNAATMDNWAAGQKVMIGINDKLFSTWYNNLLINADRQDFIKAQCLY